METAGFSYSRSAAVTASAIPTASVAVQLCLL